MAKLTVMVTKKLQDELQELVSHMKADYAEIRAEATVQTRIFFRGPEVELIAQPVSSGFFVRVLINGSWGIATCTDRANLQEKIIQAVEFAKLQGKGTVAISSPSTHTDTVKHPRKRDFLDIDLKTKFSLIKHYNQLLLAGKGIQTTQTTYVDTILQKYFVNSAGARIYQERPYVRLSYQAFAKQGDVVEISRGSTGHVGGYEVIEGLDQEMTQVAKQAITIAKSPKVTSGHYTVILDPYMAGTFAHEAFGHLSEADHQYENPKLAKQMELGLKLGSPSANIVDDPDVTGGWGNYIYDDEGVKAKKVYLLSKGVITGRLHSLETAHKLGEPINGRARADGFTSKPIVRMSNTYFKPGTKTLKDMITSTEKGLLVHNWLGGMTALENFTFTAIYAQLIEKGQLKGKVRGVKLMGNVFETLKSIDGVSQDFDIDEGTCGKEGQHMPVGSGGGYVQIHNVVVGGQ